MTVIWIENTPLNPVQCVMIGKHTSVHFEFLANEILSFNYAYKSCGIRAQTVFPSQVLTGNTWEILPKYFLCSSSRWNSPWEGKWRGWIQGKERQEEGSRAENGPVAQRPWGIWSGLWLSTHPSWPEAGKRLVSSNSALMSKHHEARNRNTTNECVWIHKVIFQQT